MSRQLPTVISYYTQGTLYEREAEHLAESCKTFGIDHHIEGVPNLGSWEKNCCFKPSFILQKLKRLDRPLVWVDADAAFVAPPKLLETIEADVAVWVDPQLEPTHPSKVISAVVYLKNSPEAIQLTEEWLAECEKALSRGNGEVWDQVCLRDVLFQEKQTASLFPLPQEYCMIYDKVEEHHTPVIMQYQASRLYKKFINNEVTPFWDAFPHEELREIREKSTKPS